jgi:hypothetical protein
MSCNPLACLRPLRCPSCDVGTTANVYIQAIPESVRKLVNAVADDVMSAKPITE